MKKKIISVACSVAALLVFGAACKWFEKPSGAQISLNEQTATIDYYQTFELEATVANSDEAIVWSSSDEQIAVVENGIVTPTNSIGDVTITATVQDVSASCLVSVIKSGDAPVLTLDRENLVLAVGDEFTLTADVSFQGELLKEKFTYSAELLYGEQEGIAQAEILGNQATFTAQSAGETIYEISTVVRDLPLVKRVNVRVVNEEVIFTSDTLEPIEGGFELNLGLTETEKFSTSGRVELSAYQNGEKLNDFIPDWTVSQTEAFDFDNGEITALKEGMGTLTTEYRGETITVYVNVIRPLIERNETLIMETVGSKTELPIALNGEVTSAFLENQENGKKYSFNASYSGKNLRYDSSALPKLASDLGERLLIVETDKARYRFSVLVYTMIINTEEELNSLIPMAKEMGDGTYWTGYYVLGNDIRCTGTYASQWDGARDGTSSTAESVGFNGIFDGQGFSIYDLRTVGVQGGLIPCLNAGGVIRNLSLVNAWNEGNGGLVVSHCCGRIENVYVTASVKGVASTRAQKYTSAFVSDIVSTARISKVFVEVLEKTGDIEYCNPFYVMHEKYGIVDGFYAVGTDSLWTVVQNVGTGTENKNCGAYADVVAMKNSGVSTKNWENDFWAVYNGLPYPKSLSLPSVALKITLSATQITVNETLKIVEVSENTIVELSVETQELGVFIENDEIILPQDLEKGVIIKVYAMNVYDPSQKVAFEVVIISENDLKDGEFDNDDVWN